MVAVTKQGARMKRGLLWMLLMTLALVMASGAALSATKQFCPNRSDGSCYGTKKADAMIGRPAGNDEMYGRGGDDLMRGYDGGDYLQGDGRKDKLYGGGRNDIVEAQRAYGFPRTTDIVNCGGGRDDTVYFDRGVDELKNCERKVPR